MHRHEAGPYGPDMRFAVHAVTGTPAAEWCERCKAYTLVCTPLYLLTHAGVTTSQHLALCSVCDDGT